MTANVILATIFIKYSLCFLFLSGSAVLAHFLGILWGLALSQ